MADINTHHLVVGFGRHKHTPYTRLPVSYLTWMVNNRTKECEYARAELKRRGTVMPTMDISGHAVDRASQKLMGAWTRTRLPDEGIHAWLIRMATEAREQGRKHGEKIVYRGIQFAFEEGLQWPVLKTVMPERG